VSSVQTAAVLPLILKSEFQKLKITNKKEEYGSKKCMPKQDK